MNSKNYWNRASKFYDKAMTKEPQNYEKIGRFLEEVCHKEMNALEIACGTGLISQKLGPLVRHLDAIDYAPQMIAKAKEKKLPDNIDFCVANAYDLPFPDHHFDGVIVVNALHIMPHPENALAEIYRVLKDDGIFIAPTFLHQSNLKTRIFSWMMSLTGFKVYHRWHLESYVHFLVQNGYILSRKALLRGNIDLCYVECKKNLAPLK